MRTVMAQVAAEATGLDVGTVGFDSGDSFFPDAPYSGASQTTATVGSAVYQAATQWRKRLHEMVGRAVDDRRHWVRRLDQANSQA